VDPKGRLIVCDQCDDGLVRVTRPPLGGAAKATQVSRINAELSGARGWLWAFDSVYVMALHRMLGAGRSFLMVVPKSRRAKQRHRHTPRTKQASNRLNSERPVSIRTISKETQSR